MSLATYLRDRLPSAFVRAAALGLVVLALAAYGVESGVLAFVTVAFLAGEATALLLDFWRRRGFYRRLDRTMEGLGEHGVGYLAPELTQEPSTLEEAAFLDALRQASKSMADQVAAMRAEQRDYRDYVETWVHEVKTPIAAGRLVAANSPGPATDAMDAELGRIEGYVEQALYYARSTTLDRDFQVGGVHAGAAHGQRRQVPPRGRGGRAPAAVGRAPADGHGRLGDAALRGGRRRGHPA